MAGYIASYFHHDGSLAAVVEFQCAEPATTSLGDFVAVARDVALHVAVANPTWISGQEVDPALWSREVTARREDLAQLNEAGQERFLADLRRQFERRYVLLRQPFAKDDTKSVADVLELLSQRLKERITITKFARFDIRGV